MLIIIFAGYTLSFRSKLLYFLSIFAGSKGTLSQDFKPPIFFLWLNYSSGPHDWPVKAFPNMASISQRFCIDAAECKIYPQITNFLKHDIVLVPIKQCCSYNNPRKVIHYNKKRCHIKLRGATTIIQRRQYDFKTLKSPRNNFNSLNLCIQLVNMEAKHLVTLSL